MNEYLKNLNKIEFIVTERCTGKCKHCSQGEHSACGKTIDVGVAADSVRKVAALYDIQTVMTFGGEPLLFPDAVYTIMNVAKELNIPKRQVITNGYFSNNIETVKNVAKRLAECGVNELLLSVDAFHQETIPLENVKVFAAEVKRFGIPIRLSPAWLVSREDDNDYNVKTGEILNAFADMEIPIGEGNIVFPEGNAIEYLSEYFADDQPKNPYEDDPCDVRCLSFSPDGRVLDGNVYSNDIIEIIDNYSPKEKKDEDKVQYIPIGMCLGISIGMAIGSVMGNIAIGMCMGIGIGMCIGVLIDSKQKNKSDGKSEKAGKDKRK